MTDAGNANRDGTQVRVPEVLRPLRSLLAVVAHPDDESFGLGGVLAALAATGRRVSLLCFTAGEGSTLGASPELARTRTDELGAAARTLGIDEHWMEELPDGGLAVLPDGELAARVRTRVEQADADAVVVLDRSGVTGHADHRAASAAALSVAAEAGLPALEWGLPPGLAEALAAEFSLEMHGMANGELLAFTVDRGVHWEAIAAHASQGPDNALLRRRLELLGDHETLRLVRPPLTGQLARFVARARRWARPDAQPAERALLLDALISFAALTDMAAWPAALLGEDPDRPYAAHCLHDDPTGWSAAAIITTSGSATPPHDHHGWGAAATVAGAERNTRYSGACPDRLQVVGEEVIPTGGGYLFNVGDIHQASDASGRTVSLHLLVGGGPHPVQHCPEPPRQ
ncbi:MAG: PIG-L family deacetylase [Actinomycetota bacterium]|jgi:LmbE family N-acetylglucosaminyl deacetylase/predicted metal-dependent enzyme (double-stranded beta helix superfamily)|nr:PIG-L family deacetylase [Actinomycetota bacterium]